MVLKSQEEILWTYVTELLEPCVGITKNLSKRENKVPKDSNKKQEKISIEQHSTFMREESVKKIDIHLSLVNIFFHQPLFVKLPSTFLL